MIYRFSDVHGLLVKCGAIFDSAIPDCPKHADPVCAEIAGKCQNGNSRSCLQRCLFYFGSTLYIIPVTFLLAPGGHDGYVLDTDVAIRRLIRKGIIDLSSLSPVQLSNNP